MSSIESASSPENAAVQVPAPATANEPILVQFGDAHVTEHWLVTPQGTIPLAGTQVFVEDMSYEDRVVPGWALALVIFGGLVLVGLLFLLVRQKRSSGFMEVTLTNGAFTYQADEAAKPDRSAQLFELQDRADYARRLIARA